MKFKNIQIIINPTSLKEEPILFYLHRAFKNQGFNWSVTVLRKGQNIGKKVNKLAKKHDLFIVYGGDGTVTAVAQALVGTKIPMAILPAGTANIIAKELGIPMDTLAAIALVLSGNEIKAIDTGTMNGIPFVIRVNFGLMASMVNEASRVLKNSLGQLAYGISALQSMASSIPKRYSLTLDGEKVSVMGVALTVTNVGNVGVEGYSFVPGITCEDGYLNVLLLEEASAFTLIKYVGTTLFQTESEVLKQWKCREVKIELAEVESIVCDDMEWKERQFTIRVVPHSLSVLVPLAANSVA